MVLVCMHGSVVLLKFHGFTWCKWLVVASLGEGGVQGCRVSSKTGCGGPAQQPSCKPYNLSLILFNIKDLERATEGQLSSKTQFTLSQA